MSGVLATVTASATARMVPIGQIGQASSADAGSIGSLTTQANVVIVDFGSSQQVSGLSLGTVWEMVEYIDGAGKWQPLKGSITTPPEVHTTENFSATTSQLRITFSTPVSPSLVAVSGSVLIAVPPVDLDILVNANRAWAWPGAAEPAPFTAKADLTPAVQGEIDAGRLPVKVRLRSRTPGTLTLELNGDVDQVWPVVFPEGPVRSVVVAAEGDLFIQLPVDATRWRITGVTATVAAQCGPERAVPPTGPTASPDAAIVVDPDRAVTIGLPLASTGSLAQLTGIRIPVMVGTDGAELRGALRADDGSQPDGIGEPGQPLPLGQLGPTALDHGAAVQWASLLLPKPHLLTGAGAIWVDVAATRGSVEWALAVAPGQPGARASIRRPNAGGGYRPLSQIAGIDTDAATVRVVGVPPPQAPVFPAALAVDGADSKTTVVPSATTGTALTATFSLLLQSAPWLPLRLKLTALAAGTFTVSGVSVTYNPSPLPVS